MVVKVGRGSLLTVALALGLVAACSSGAGTTTAPKAAAAAPLTIGFPSIVVPAGVENTQCVVVGLHNDKPLHIGAIHNVLGNGSHHLVVYRVSDPVEKTTPFDCHPFTDTLDPTKGSPLMITQKKDDLLTLPSGVGYSLVQNQMFRIEMHYINPTPKDETVSASTTVVPISDDDFKDEADFLFIGNPSIKLQPHATATLGPTYFQVPDELADVKFFAMTGHEHQLGTNVRVATAANPTDPGTMIYDVPDWKWSEPKTQVFDAPVKVPVAADGTVGGFSFTCDWNNTSDQVVRFGESANDEMCFFWAYYYPSQGAKVCFHTDKVGSGGQLDLCCPGSPFCNVINSKLTGP